MKKETFTDKQIIEAIKDGNNIDPYILYLYRASFESLVSLVKKNSGSFQDAEDVFQETLVSFIKMVKREGYREEASVKTFIYSIGKNIWSNKLRKREKGLDRDTKFYHDTPKIEHPVSELIQAMESKQHVNDILGQLGDTCKNLLVYFYYEDLPMKNILEKLDYKNEQTVRNKKFKCMKQLIQLMDGDNNLKTTLKNLLKEKLL